MREKVFYLSISLLKIWIFKDDINYFRQKREKAVREQKDKLILRMALEQKKKMAEGKKVQKKVILWLIRMPRAQVKLNIKFD